VDRTAGWGVAEIRKVVAEAFAEDPLIGWIFPDDDRRLEASAAWLGLFLEGYVEAGRIDVVEEGDELVAVAVWRIPHDAPLPRPELPSIPGLLAALVGGPRSAAIGAGLHVLTSAWPQGPFAYLHFLAVSPQHQRRGMGRQVIQPGLAAAEAAGLGVELESTNPENLSFYRSLGFAVTRELVIEPDGPPAWAMWRPHA
jgi:ribosomal protein S18 acetylase RimI-like enzyme